MTIETTHNIGDKVKVIRDGGVYIACIENITASVTAAYGVKIAYKGTAKRRGNPTLGEPEIIAREWMGNDDEIKEGEAEFERRKHIGEKKVKS